MPVIQVDGPPVDIDKKRRLVKELTDVAVSVYEIEHIIVLIRENPAKNVGSNGVLISDKRRSEG